MTTPNRGAPVPEVEADANALPPIGALLKAIATFGDITFLQDGRPAIHAIADAIAWWEVDFTEFLQKVAALVAAARSYANDYMQDEAENDPKWFVCGIEQRKAAQRVFAALSALTTDPSTGRDRAREG